MASKTLEVRKVITKLLRGSGNEVYYEEATQNAGYPYIVFSFSTVDLNNSPRDDYFLVVDIWDRNKQTLRVEEIADEVEEILSFTNSPTETILPTFYKTSRDSIPDENKMLKRRQLRFNVQNYYIGG